jgi:hypothetical protein
MEESAIRSCQGCLGSVKNRCSQTSSGECAYLSVAKITSAFIFIAFQLAQIGRPNELSTVKTSVLLFNFSAG